MIRFTHLVGVVVIAFSLCSAHGVWAVAPSALENAYWRFEEGVNGNLVDTPNANVISDYSGNNNSMRAYLDTVQDPAFPNDSTKRITNPDNPHPNASPTYTNFVPFQPLKNGDPNGMGFYFDPHPNGKDIYSDGRHINNGIIAPGGGFTIEAAFNSSNPATWGTIIGKEGRPKLGNADADLASLPTFSLMTNADNSHLMVQEFDAAGDLVIAQSQQPLNANQWYYTAVVNDGEHLSLWLDSGSGYELQETIDVDGALYQGPDYNDNTKVDAGDYVKWRKENSADPSAYDHWRASYGNGPDWDYNWSIGRGVQGGKPSGDPANWFTGYIDEVRLSNHPLSSTDFLFAPAATGVSVNAVPEPASLSLAGLTVIATQLARRRRQRKLLSA